MGRYARRADANQKEVTKELRQLGYSVSMTHAVASGFPDLAVGKNGFTLLVELKDPSKPPSQRKLNERERAWFDNWKGAASVCETVEDVVQDFKLFAGQVFNRI